MKLGRCPVCHANVHLDAMVQDDCARELVKTVAGMDRYAASALVTYLSLFRSANRDLSNDRALKLATEALALAATEPLTQAMQHTVESVRGKGSAPLKNHNYLKRVLETQGHEASTGALSTQPAQRAAVSKTGQALQSLEQLK